MATRSSCWFVVRASKTDREAEHRLHTEMVNRMRYLRTVAPEPLDKKEL